MSKPCIDRDFIKKYLEQLLDFISMAYYTTPPHISSKSLIKRSKDLVESLIVSISSSSSLSDEL
ncbi:MAG: hypothetical protein ABWW65_01970 [Thermoprotei archaeon]